jgi:hypothetical protein
MLMRKLADLDAS